MKGCLHNRFLEKGCTGSPSGRYRSGVSELASPADRYCRGELLQLPGTRGGRFAWMCIPAGILAPRNTLEAPRWSLTLCGLL